VIRERRGQIVSDKAVSEPSPVRYRDLREYLKLLEGAGLLKRVNAEVDLKHEIGAICVKSLKMGGPGLLFENITGYKGMPLVTNILSRTEQLAIAFGAEADDAKIYEAIQTGKANPIPPCVVEGGPCQEEVHAGDEVDIYKFPAPWWHELDGGQYIGTTAGVITADPDTGYLNMGIYRVMNKDKNTLAVNIRGNHPIGKGPRKEGGRYGCDTHILKNEVRGRSTPVAIAIGMDPVLTYVGAQHVPSEKFEHAEYAMAGGIGRKPVELVKCRTNDLLVPANAEIILEGEVVANERIPEGPHGEAQGFYGSNDHAFKIKVQTITHRKNPIGYGLICTSHEDYPKLLKSAALQSMLQSIANIIKEAYVPDIIGGRCLMAIISAKVRSSADVERVIEAIEKAPYDADTAHKPRWSIIVDDDCDVRDWEDVMWRAVMAVMPDKDVKIGSRTDPITHEPLAYLFDSKASSIIIDATFRSKLGIIKGREGFPLVSKISKELMSRVEGRWKEYGIT